MKRRRQVPALVVAALLVTAGCSRDGSGPTTGDEPDMGALEDIVVQEDTSADDAGSPSPGDDLDAELNDGHVDIDVDGSAGGELPAQCTEYGAELPMPGEPCDQVGDSQCTNLDAYILEGDCSTCFYERTYCIRPWRLECQLDGQGNLLWFKAENCQQAFVEDGECLKQQWFADHASCQLQPSGGGTCCPLSIGGDRLCNDADSLGGGPPAIQGKAKCYNAEEIAATHMQDVPFYSECAHAFPQCRYEGFSGQGCPTKKTSVLCEVDKDKWGEPECKCFNSKPVPDETGLLICSTTCEQLGEKAGDCAGRSWPPCGDTLDGEP